MKPIWTIVMLASMLSLYACQPPTITIDSKATPHQIASVTPLPINDAAKPILKTSLGDFEIVNARFVDEVKGVTPGEGEKILLLSLGRPGGERLDSDTFSLEAFDKMAHDTTQGEIQILGEDGSATISSMGGWVEEEFVMGFRLSAELKTYTLIWPNNAPITILPEG